LDDGGKVGIGLKDEALTFNKKLKKSTNKA
jgi:hypothetical protein